MVYSIPYGAQRTQVCNSKVLEGYQKMVTFTTNSLFKIKYFDYKVDIVKNCVTMITYHSSEIFYNLVIFE